MTVFRYAFSGVALACFLFVLAAPGRAQMKSVFEDSLFRTEAERGLDLLYNMQFEQANVVFNDLSHGYPGHPAVPFLRALNTWWTIMVDLSDESHDRRFYREMDQVIALANRRLKKDRRDIDGMFFKGAALGFRGRLHSNRRNWFQAARDGKRAMDYVLGVAEVAPQNNDFYFGWGIYDYFADVLPKRHRLLRAAMVFFTRGDRERGLAELKRVAERGRFMQPEATYFLTQIYYVFEDDFENSARYVDVLRERYPDNSFFHALAGRIYARWNRWDRAVPVFEQILARHNAGQLGYTEAMAEQAYYYLARHEMTWSNYQLALARLEQLHRLAAKRKKETVFTTLGRLRQGMAYDALGRRREAVQCYRDVLAAKDWSGSRDRARQYLNQPFGHDPAESVSRSRARPS